jgi:hypothetical protein
MFHGLATVERIRYACIIESHSAPEVLIYQTFIDYANEQGDAILELFKSTDSNVLSEYNAPTYYGMDTWALAGAFKYGPKNATMTKNSRFMLTELWADIAAHYNPYLGNMVGPVGTLS